tara:strand:- start:1187 stop:1546 length:360 start_codon:yes stop_codon:yes gene_type:complete
MEVSDPVIAKKYLSKIKSCSASKVTFSLSFYEYKRLVTARKCKYTGISLTWQSGVNQIPTDVTIDRIDNNKGYVTGNVVACCKGYNSFKGVLENPNNIITFSILEKALQIQKKLQGGKL